MSKEWYQRHLNPAPAPQVAPPQRIDSTPGRFAPMPGAWPTHVPQTAQPQQQHPAMSPGGGTAKRFDPEYYASLNFGERMRYLEENVNPGVGAQDAKLCPNCGADGVFSRQTERDKARGAMPPCPECFTCGWPNLQSGSMGVQVVGQ